MINPKNLKALCKPWNDDNFAGGKQYLPALSGDGQIYRARKVFERRSQAQEYAEKLLQVWRRVYPLFVAWEAQSEPATDEVSA
jgi:hypothetical protein